MGDNFSSKKDLHYTKWSILIIKSHAKYMTKVYIPGYGVYTIRKDWFYRYKFHALTSILFIYCRKCSARIMIYQKDGKQGFLKRCYANRIISLGDKKKKTQKRTKILHCPNCKVVIGKGINYKGRFAFALLPHSVKRRTVYKNWKRGVKYS